MSKQVYDFSRQQNSTLFVSLLTSYAVTLAMHSGQNDVVIGSPTANRNNAYLEGIIGFFVNTMVLRMQLHDNPTLADLSQRANRLLLEAMEHQNIARVLDAGATDSGRPYFVMELVRGKH